MWLLWLYGWYGVFLVSDSIFLLCSREEASLVFDPIR